MPLPTIDRSLDGDALLFGLAEEEANAMESALPSHSARNARTIVKSEALRVTIIVLPAGGAIPEHHADGPITVQVLRGMMEFAVAGDMHQMGIGQLLYVGAGVRHYVSTVSGCTFLLTLARCGKPLRARESSLG